MKFDGGEDAADIEDWEKEVRSSAAGQHDRGAVRAEKNAIEVEIKVHGGIIGIALLFAATDDRLQDARAAAAQIKNTHQAAWTSGMRQMSRSKPKPQIAGKTGIQPGAPVALRLTTNEREIIFHLAGLDLGLEDLIWQTPAAMPNVLFTPQQLGLLGGFLAIEARQHRGVKVTNCLNLICQRIERAKEAS